MDVIERLHKGSVYRVTLAFAAWYAFPPRWWPVLGPLHSDVEFFNFRQLHFHIDARFLPAKVRDRAKRHWEIDATVTLAKELREQGHPVDLFPLCNFMDPKIYAASGKRERIAAGPAILDRCVRVGRRRCVIEEWPSRFLWRATTQTVVRNLCAAYSGMPAAGLVCPHRKVDLSNVQPRTLGDRRLLECPAHGLVFEQSRSGEWICMGKKHDAAIDPPPSAG